MYIIQCGLALSDPVWLDFVQSLFRTFRTSDRLLCHSRSARADRCSDDWHCQVLGGFCMGSMVAWQTFENTQSLPGLLKCSMHGCTLRRIEALLGSACGEDHM